jgi:hypothetical protein
MWRETDDGKQLAEQMRGLFLIKSCKVKDTSGESLKLGDDDRATLRTEFQFVSD